MKEIEVKILEIDVADIKKKLEGLGAKIIFDGTLKNIYFDTEDNSLENNGCVMRLRFDGEKAILTHKDKITHGTVKVADETELTVEDFDNMHKILERIGFKEKFTYSKKRISYGLEGVHFELDSIEGIPTFLEIESEDEEVIKKYVELLGFKQSDAKNWGTRQLCKHYGVDYCKR
jgi:adenylate cyclase class 2